MKLIDNVNNRLGDDLKESIRKGSKLSIAASTFSIYAFEALKKELGKIDELRFIFSSPTFVEEELQKQSRQFYIPNIVRESEICGGEFELRLMNQLNQRTIAKECSRWVKEKVQTTAAVKKVIENHLFLKLPYPTYDEDVTLKVEILFNDFKERFANYAA